METPKVHHKGKHRRNASRSSQRLEHNVPEDIQECQENPENSQPNGINNKTNENSLGSASVDVVVNDGSDDADGGDDADDDDDDEKIININKKNDDSVSVESVGGISGSGGGDCGGVNNIGFKYSGNNKGAGDSDVGTTIDASINSIDGGGGGDNIIGDCGGAGGGGDGGNADIDSSDRIIINGGDIIITTTTCGDNTNNDNVIIDERDEKITQKGILGYVEREIQVNNINKKSLPPQTLSDPTASPAQRSTRSRSSLDKSPRCKRSKSESRRRRERKLIAAGEMEVRQANETLMRYLKQCSEINDASLSGELEIDKNIEDRKVHRKTKSQRERRTINNNGNQQHQQIQAHSQPHQQYQHHHPQQQQLQQQALQQHHHIQRVNSNNNNIVNNIDNLHHHRQHHNHQRMPSSGLQSILRELSDDIIPNNGEIYNPFTPVISPTDGSITRVDKMFIQTSRGYRSVDHSYYKSSSIDHLDPESNSIPITNGIQLSCAIQRTWMLISNICHGFLGGLALAHILFILTTKPYDWNVDDDSIKHYSSFANLYSNVFYCLAIICVVSILDRMDICRINLSNASESIKFKWIIIIMIYLATIILNLSNELLDERLYLLNYNNTKWEVEMENNRIKTTWNLLSIARSIGAVFGWILVGLSPIDDLFYDYLYDMEKYHFNNN